MSVCMTVYEMIPIPDDVEAIVRNETIDNEQLRYLIGLRFGGKDYIPDRDKNKLYIQHANWFGHTRNRRMYREDNKFPYKSINTPIGTLKVALLNEVYYTQGWWLNKKFFKKSETTIICSTKAEFERFWNNYVDHNRNDSNYAERRQGLYDFMQNNFIEGKHIFEYSF